MEYYGSVKNKNADFSNFKVKKDGNGEILPVNKELVVTAAAKDGAEFEIDSRVAFTISPDGSEVLSLRESD